MIGIPLVRASSLLAYVDSLRILGAPVDPILSAVRLPPVAELRPDALVSYQQALDFIAAGRRRTGLPDLPLRASGKVGPEHLGTWGRMIGRGKTLGGLLELTVRTYPLHTTGARWWIADRGSDVLLCQQFDRRLDLGGGDAIVTLLAHMVRAMRLALGERWQPREITLGAPIGVSLAPLGIDAPVRVSGWTSIAIPRAVLSTPMPRIGAAAAAFEPVSLQALAESAPATEFAGSLHQALAPLVCRSDVEIETLAEITRLTVRTLQRRLAEAGLTFRSVVQELRFARALDRMQDPGAKLIDVAYEVGFSDPAHFTRAFRRWTGIAPREFRRRHLAEGRPMRWKAASAAN